MRSFALFSVPFVLAFASFEATARAEPTSWLSLGGGFGLERNAVTGSGNGAGAIDAVLGVGSSSDGRIVVGGVARAVTYFGLGTDLGLAARFANGGFVRGEWGFAFDAGVAFRLYNTNDHGRTPLQAVLTLGMPWGPQIALGAQFLSLVGDNSTVGGFALFEIDLLRLTVMRKGSTDAYWFNPSPAGGRDK